ncbi:MAG: 3-hydroxybutyrate dehydrogenase [Rhodospirillales bacterium]|nr:3-hydroxybutyrate dehydrogenase [Rhodospirillales bacterium]
MLKNKVALVTGSTSGIGLAVAQSLAAVGADIVLNGSRPADQAEDIRADIEKTYGVKVFYFSADMSDPVEIAKMMSLALNEFEIIDVLVNNAGIQFVSPIDEFPDDKWNAIIDINMNSAFHTTKAVLPGMKSKGWGRVINIASAHALVASPYKSAYVTAKHGLLGMTKTVALEVAAQGITCNAICPGYVLTPLVEKQIPNTAKARGISEDQVINDIMLAPQATKKFVGLEELGALATYLCSDGAASLTGTAIPMDGGWTAH